MSTKVVTGVVRLAFSNVFTPRANKQNPEKLQYSAVGIIDKSDKKTVADLMKSMQDAVDASDIKGIKLFAPGHPKCPIKDGDEEREDRPEFAGCYFINVKSKNKPGAISANGQHIIDPEDLYSGCYVRFSITPWPYNHEEGGKGVSLQLNSVMKVKDGDRLSGGGQSNPEEDFAGYVKTDYSDDVPY